MVGKDTARGVVGMGLDFPGRSNCQRLPTAVTFLRGCVAQALSRLDGCRHSLLTLARFREYNENLFFFFNLELYYNSFANNIPTGC